MSDRLREAIERLDSLDAEMSPVERARLREDTLIEGLNALAEQHGLEIEPTRIDARGEMDFNVVGPDGRGEGRPSGRYGEELAEILSTVPRRTGSVPYDGPVLPENGWCRINHFDVERMLRTALERSMEIGVPGLR